MATVTFATTVAIAWAAANSQLANGKSHESHRITPVAFFAGALAEQHATTRFTSNGAESANGFNEKADLYRPTIFANRSFNALEKTPIASALGTSARGVHSYDAGES
ncbi:hypothetical protein CA13_12260 [Planctomycetes bacterium CA13]|uniref:Uncharacterized protein n=1 Tax=Novipirellula herctigrandis TaxID=2527986 RepID=A0A5C5YXM4_9BACT|nr:hypothetical protein CA13_12260 [Planctomycetes bacterium CA13]